MSKTEKLLNAEELSEKVRSVIDEADKEVDTEEKGSAETVESQENIEEKEIKEEDSQVPSEETKEEVKEEETPSEEPEPTEEDLKKFATENNIPKSIGLDVVKEWKNLPDSVKSTLVRNAQDADRFASKYKENQSSEQKRREELGSANAYIKQTARNANISENQVIKNVVDWVAAVEDNPDATLNQAIGTVIKVKDPITLINTVMQRYGITEEQLKTPRQFSEQQRIDYEIREAQNRRQQERTQFYNSVANEDVVMEEAREAVEDFKYSHPEDIALLDDPRFNKIVALERTDNPDKSAKEVLESAYAFFKDFQHKNEPAAPIVQEQPKPAVDLNKKLQAVSLKSTPNVATEEKNFSFDPTNMSKTIADLKARVHSKLGQ